MEEGYVLVVGNAGVDIRGYVEGPVQLQRPNVGAIHNDKGGVARNIAENLARLDVDVVLLSAIGDDDEGDRVLEHTSAAGVDCDHVLQVSDARTACYVAILDEHGEEALVLVDDEVTYYIDSVYLLEHEYLFEDAAMLVIDASLSESALVTLFDIARRHNLLVAADPTSSHLAGKLCRYLDQLALLTPNADETTALCGLSDPARDRETAINAARSLVSLGVGLAVVTLGGQGLAYADARGGGYIRAQTVGIADPTGAGDAMTAALVFAMLNEVEIDEAMRLGITAAALTLQSAHTVLPELSQELLYDELVV